MMYHMLIRGIGVIRNYASLRKSDDGALFTEIFRPRLTGDSWEYVSRYELREYRTIYVLRGKSWNPFRSLDGNAAVNRPRIIKYRIAGTGFNYLRVS